MGTGNHPNRIVLKPLRMKVSKAPSQPGFDSHPTRIMLKVSKDPPLEVGDTGVSLKASKGLSRTFDGVKVFSATVFTQREQLGERVTEWIRGNPQMSIVDTVITQSSDSAFHCISLCLFYRGQLG